MTGDSVLRFLLGLLVAGPLLSTVWKASGEVRLSRQRSEKPPANMVAQTAVSIPYTLAGSASDRLVSWLRRAAIRLQHTEPQLGTLLAQGMASAVFALAAAAQLGQRTLLLVVTALLCACARSVSRGKSTTDAFMSISVPIFLSWLLGHAAYAHVRAESALVAGCFALSFGAFSRVHRTGESLLRQLAPQLGLVACLVMFRQPAAAAASVLLGSLQLLLVPLLQTLEGRMAYFRTIQTALAITMLLSAWALG